MPPGSLPYSLAKARLQENLAELQIRIWGFGLVVVVADDPDEALDVDPVARRRIAQLLFGPGGQIQKAVIDVEAQPRLVIRGEAAPDAGRKSS